MSIVFASNQPFIEMVAACDGSDCLRPFQRRVFPTTSLQPAPFRTHHSLHSATWMRALNHSTIISTSPLGASVLIVLITLEVELECSLAYSSGFPFCVTVKHAKVETQRRSYSSERLLRSEPRCDARQANIHTRSLACFSAAIDGVSYYNPSSRRSTTMLSVFLCDMRLVQSRGNISNLPVMQDEPLHVVEAVV